MNNKFIPIILGTDINSYSVAVLIHRKYNIKPIVIGAGTLIPFYNTKIAKLYIDKNLRESEEDFVNFINYVYKKEAKNNEKAIFFFPNEAYLEELHNVSDELKFDFEIPYPEKDMFNILRNKEEFYREISKLGFVIPTMFVADKDNYKEVVNHFDDNTRIFMKASNYENFVNADIPDYQKGYKMENINTALKELEHIFNNSYDGEVIVQTYINGGSGTEYSLNGYNTPEGNFKISIAKNLLSDPRPKWIGNHIISIENDNPELEKIAKDLVDKMKIYGLFNIDIKVDSETDQVYIIECNPRQGRSFYYSYLSGVNLIEVAIEDKINNKRIDSNNNDKFIWAVASNEINRRILPEEFLDRYNDLERQNNSVQAINYEKDNDIERKNKLKDYQEKTDELYLSLFNEC